MLPVGPLMIEHRLIEKMIVAIRNEIEWCERKINIDQEFIDNAADFIRVYADKCHHGKEEDILFRELNKKPLSDEHKRIMEELVAEHRQGRKAVAEMMEAKEQYVQGNREMLPVILGRMRFIADFYPKHIEKEDQQFFLPCMDYFTTEEKDSMLKEEWEFDKNLIHQIYRERVEKAEKLISCS